MQPGIGKEEEAIFELNLLRYASLAHAVDAAADDDLETPLAISQFEYFNRLSSNTDVRDLIQSEPDFPIGGQQAAPMTSPLSIGTQVMLCTGTCGTDGLSTVPGVDGADTKSESSQKALIRTLSSAASRLTKKRPLESYSNFSEPSQSPLPTPKPHFFRPDSPAASEQSLLMATAPDTPFQQAYTKTRCDTTDISIKDITTGVEGSISGDCCDASHSVGNLDGGHNIACCELGAEEEGLLPCPLSYEDMCPGPELCPERPGFRNGLPIPPEELDAIFGGMPLDATGDLPAPATLGRRKSGRGKAKLLKGIRKSRAVCLRTPVLSVVIGRQLAGPTKTALKAIADATAVDLDALTTAAVPIPIVDDPAAAPLLL